MLSLPLVLAAVGAGYWLTGGRYETTENANLHLAHVSIEPSVGGRITTVNMTDNQTVHAGDLLFQVDPEPYRLALAQTEAGLGGARLKVEQMKLSYRQAVVEATLAADDASYLRSELDRQQTLAGRGVTTGTALDEARHASDRADIQRALADQGVAMALAAIGGNADLSTDDHPTVRAALVALAMAAYDLAQTRVTAPADGVIYQASSFKTGQMVAPGQAVFALVETGDAWIEANLKETQLGDVAVGQTAEVTFDLAPDRIYAAHVTAIGVGTGAEFSLLPAQNATGNWVKVTQRVPVRLTLDSDATAQGLSSGVSAYVSIDTGRKRSLSDLIPAFLTGK